MVDRDGAICGTHSRSCLITVDFGIPYFSWNVLEGGKDEKGNYVRSVDLGSDRKSIWVNKCYIIRSIIHDWFIVSAVQSFVVLNPEVTGSDHQDHQVVEISGKLCGQRMFFNIF